MVNAHGVRQLVRAFAIDAGDTPPSEFRIFKAGVNECPRAHGVAGTDGAFQFTARSAELIMAEFARCGVDMMIDLEHEALDKEAVRADSRDARGWFGLEVRAGELWAVNVRWTDDGARRLTSKTQRYISPAFAADTGTREIVDLTNCALVARPAMHGAPALVAASRDRAPLTEADKDVCRKALRMLASGTRV
jgi:phage I-like protein